MIIVALCGGLPETPHYSNQVEGIMKLNVSRTTELKVSPKTVPEFETAAIEAVCDCVNFFEKNDIRFGPEGLYMQIGETVHLFSVEINYKGRTEEYPRKGFFQQGG